MYHFIQQRAFSFCTDNFLFSQVFIFLCHFYSYQTFSYFLFIFFLSRIALVISIFHTHSLFVVCLYTCVCFYLKVFVCLRVLCVNAKWKIYETLKVKDFSCVYNLLYMFYTKKVSNRKITTFLIFFFILFYFDFFFSLKVMEILIYECFSIFSTLKRFA